MKPYQGLFWDLKVSNVSSETELLKARDRLVRVSEDIVRDDLNQMDSVIKNGLIPENEFLERYWKFVIDCRALLKVIPKHLEQEIKNNFDLYIRAACVNIVQ